MKIVALNFLVGGLFLVAGVLQIKAGFMNLRLERAKHADESLHLRVVTTQFIKRAEAASGGIFISHKPEEGCPPGWQEQPGLYTDKDGSTHPACILTKSHNGEIGGDYLRPGESMATELLIQLRPAPQKDRL